MSRGEQCSLIRVYIYIYIEREREDGLMFASTLPKNTMTQIRQVALVLVDTLLGLFPSFWNCSSARAAAACFATRILVFHLREEGGRREGVGGRGERKKEERIVEIKVYSFLPLIAKDFLNLFYLLFHVENVERSRSICERISWINYIKVRYFEKSFQ